jgi:hypothetical protein
MTEEDRKFLTEQMDECWHGYSLVFEEGIGEVFKCSCFLNPNATPGLHVNRTFDTWTDFGVVQEKLWNQQFMEWLERLLSWREWEQKTPEERCRYYLRYYRELA